MHAILADTRRHVATTRNKRDPHTELALYLRRLRGDAAPPVDTQHTPTERLDADEAVIRHGDRRQLASLRPNARRALREMDSVQGEARANARKVRMGATS